MDSFWLKTKLGKQWPWLAASVLLMVCLMPGRTFAQDESTDDAPLEVVISTEIPSAPTEVESPPTAEPTLLPATDPPTVIPAPTEILQDPTEQPVLPTDEPASSPDIAPTTIPSPTPTPRAAIPFAPIVNCDLRDGERPAIAGERGWSMQECSATWQTETVTDVTAEVWSDDDGWQTIAVNAATLDTQQALDASDGVLELSNSTADDARFTSSQFYIGTRLNCTSSTTTEIHLRLTATSTTPVAEDQQGNPLESTIGESVTESATTSWTVSGTNPPTATVEVSTVSFSEVDPNEMAPVAHGVVAIDYSGASTGCPWVMTIDFDDFVADGFSLTVPAANITLSSESAFAGDVTSLGNGKFTLAFPSGSTTDGTVTLQVNLQFNSVPGPFTYSSTVDVSASNTP